VGGERGLGFPDEAIGLGCVQATLDRHYPCCGNMAGVDGEHGVVISFEGGLDVANDEEVVTVAPGHLRGESVEAGSGSVGPRAEIVQYRGDVGQGQPRAAEQTDELTGADLGSAVTAVAVGVADRDRPQQPDSVVNPERL